MIHNLILKEGKSTVDNLEALSLMGCRRETFLGNIEIGKLLTVLSIKLNFIRKIVEIR